MKRYVSLLLALSMMLALAACGSNSTGATDTESSSSATTATETAASSGEPQYGGSVTLYYPKFYNYFDPAMSNEYQYSFWYETLWVIDWQLNDSDTYSFDAGAVPAEYLQGQLATDDYTFDETAGTLTVTLRDDVKFQDGEPYNGRALVASDVVWSYSRLLGINGETKISVDNYDWTSTLDMIKNVEATDDHTVVFTFNDGMANTVSLAALMNAKVNIAGPEWDSCPQTWEYAKGTGPYVLTNYVTDNSMTLTKNENYYDYDERYPENKLPYIDTINLVYIADSANILAQAMSGSLDWFGENGKNVLTYDQLEQLDAKSTGTTYEYMSSSPAAIALKVTQEPFNDIRVRQAMQYAIDLSAMNQYMGVDGDVVIPGLWSPTLSWSTVGSWSDDLTSQYTYDPDKAKELLTEAGYPDGFTFELELDPTANLELYQMAASYLQAVGITVDITVAPEMMEAVSHSQDYTDVRQSAGYGGGFSSYSLALMMTGDSAMPNAYGHEDTEYLAQLHAVNDATSAEEQVAAAQLIDQEFPAKHWAILIDGMQPTYDFVSNRIGGYNGEKVYYDQNMRTIWSRLWVQSGS
ncbi:MAG: peptide transporter substrate-binding protein [Oscillospiraceae bacterium]|nr:peptide transporter substrate-binding protein [Oscillospiraceae bacterium]